MIFICNKTKKSNNLINWVFNAMIEANKVTSYLQIIPQGTVNNNIGPDRLVGPKALDPNFLMHDLCLNCA